MIGRLKKITNTLVMPAGEGVLNKDAEKAL